MDSRVTVDPIFAAFAVEATVTRPNEAPIETEAVWMPTSHNSQFALGEIDNHHLEIMRTVRRRVIALRVDEVPAAPVGTLIEAPEASGAPVQSWLVDEIGYVENDLLRVFVRPLDQDAHLARWGKN